MKSNITFFIIFSLLSVICLISNESHADPLTNFYLDSALGTRTLENQPITSTTVNNNFAPRKSPNEAFLYSLAIPGMGQLYTGAKHGYIYTAAEVGLLVTYFVLRNSAMNTRDEYREVVRQNIIFEGPGNFEAWDPIEDFEHATQYENWNHVYDSEQTRTRTGKWYWKDLDPSLKNERDSTIEFDSKYRLDAFDLRQKANDRFQSARTILGLVILNHVFSAVEARITTKRWNAKQQQSRSFEIDLQTDMSKGALTTTLVLKKKF